MNDKLMDALAQWPGSVKFGGKYAGVEDKLNAELERRKKELAEQTGEGERGAYYRPLTTKYPEGYQI